VRAARRSRQLFRASAQSQQAFAEPLGHHGGRDPGKVSGLPPGVPAARQEQRLALRPGQGRKAVMCQQAPWDRPGSPGRRRSGRAAVTLPGSLAHGTAARYRHDPAEPAAPGGTEPRRGPPHLQQYPRGHLLRPGLISDDLVHQAVNRAGDLIADVRERLFVTACDSRQQTVNSSRTGLPVLTACVSPTAMAASLHASE
jgi:hypothetical protein